METQPDSLEEKANASRTSGVSDRTSDVGRDTPKGTVARPIFWLTFVILSSLILIWWSVRSEIAGLRSELTQGFAVRDRQVESSSAVLGQDHASVESLQAKVAALEVGLAEAQGQSAAFEVMYREVMRSRDERLLAEIEQTLATAAQQLQLAGNVESALIALQTADSRLAGNSQPRFVAVRRLIAHDILRLKALPSADITGLTLKLENVIAAVDGLPLAFERRPQAAVAKQSVKSPASPDKSVIPDHLNVVAGLRQLGSEIWQEVRQLVRVERTDQVDSSLLSPSQSYFLRENLKLRLLSARLALMQRDSRSYREELRQARDSLTRFFDVRAKPVQAVLETLQRATDSGVTLELPTLDETLSAVRAIKLARDKS